MAKEKEKKKIKPLAPAPTYTPIDASLNKTYIQPRGALKSNIVVSQADLAPAPRSNQPLQVRGALAPPVTSKPVGTISEPIGLPSMEQQLRTATTAFTPQSVRRDLRPIQSAPTINTEADRLQKMADANKAAGKISTAGMSKDDYVAYAKLKQMEAKQADAARPKGIVEKTGQFLGQFYTPGAGLSAITGATGAAENLVSRVAPSIGRGTGLGATVAREALKEGIVGTPLAAGQALAQEPGISGREFAQQTALGAGLGAVGGGVLAGLGKGAQAIISKYRKPTTIPQPTLGLPAPRQRGQVSAAITPQTITPEYTFGLPEPSPAIARRELNVAEARNDLKVIDDEIRQLNSAYDRAIVDEYNFLKQSMKERGGVQQGQLQRDAEGKVVGRAGRISQNPLWYQEAFASTGRAPSNKELHQIAKNRVDNGFKSEEGDVPSWKEQNGFNESMDSLQSVRNEIDQSLREIDPAINLTSTPLKTQELSFKHVSGKTREGVTGALPQGQAVRAPIASRQALSTQPQVTEMVAPRTKVTGERAFFSNLEQGGLTTEVQARMSESEKRGYEQITNVETVNTANKRIENLGVDRAEAQLLGKTKFKADDVATGMRLIQELQNSGQVERAVSVAEKVAKQLTEAGQTVQAASIWARLSPEGALLAAQRKVNRINENLLRGQAEVKLSPAQAQEITDAAGTIQAAGGSSERAGTVMEIMDRVRNGETVSPSEKEIIADLFTDMKRFLKPTDTRPPRPAKPPKEMDDVRVRDRVTSFLETQEQAALERIRARRGRANALPLDEWADYAIVGATKLAKGTIKFADWSEQMVSDLGNTIQPYLRQIYEKAQEVQLQSAKQINEQVISKAERLAESFIKQKGDELTTGDVDFIRDMAQRVSSLSTQERRLASQDLQAIMQSFEKVGVGRKIAAAQYIAMLLNPLTQIRNIVGNEMMYRLERMSKLVGTPIDIVASKVTGGPRTITFKSGPSVWDDFFKPAKDFLESLPEGGRAGYRGVSPEGLTTKYEIQGQAFRSKYNPLTYMEKALGAVLQGFDYAAYTRATNQTLSEMAYLDALNKGIQGDDAIRNHMQTYMTNLDDATHNIAKDYGKFATLQDDSTLATAIMGFRRKANVLTTGSPEFGAGSLVVPFAKTPANLLLRGLDYSPAGILKAMKQTYEVLRNPNTDLTRADVINSVSRALMGTGMGAMAYWLADKGAMFGRSNKDPEVRKLMQGTGIKDFQINGSALMRMMQAIGTGQDVDQAAKLQPGDTLWAYQWAQPSSMPMAIGSNIYQSSKDKQGVAQTVGEAALAGATTLLDSSVLSGIREIFQITPGEDNVFKAVGMNLLKQLPSQFVPSMARQFNVLFDEKLRETMAPKGDTLGSITNYAESTIPGLAQQMPQRVSTLGEPQTRLNTFVDVFLSPAARSKYNPTPEAQLVIDLLNETGDKNLAPRAVAKYLSGKDIATGEQRRVDLTPEQFVELQTIVGQETANRLKKINPDLPTDRKIEMVIDAFDKAGKIGRNKLKQDVGLRKTK